jgi:hypothetical protein
MTGACVPYNLGGSATRELRPPRPAEAAAPPPTGAEEQGVVGREGGAGALAGEVEDGGGACLAARGG